MTGNQGLQEKEMREKLQAAEEENGILKENLKTAMGEKDSLSIAFELLKNEAQVAEKTHSSEILEWESRANHLRDELQNMSNACETNQSIIDNYKAKNDESSRRMEMTYEARIQDQIEAHTKNVKDLEMSFLLQMEEQRKGSKIQLDSMEESLLRQKEEKARAKEAYAKYIRDLEIVNGRLDDQESKFLSNVYTYNNKIVELEEKLGKIEIKGLSLEDDLNSLLKRVKEHTDHSKQVVKNLQEARSSYSAVEIKLTALAQELELDALSARIQAQKDAEMAEQRSKHENFLRRNKMECSEEVQLMTLEHDRALQELKRTLDAAEKKEAILVRGHMNALKVQLSSIEAEWKRRQETLAEQSQRRREDEKATSRKHFQSDLDNLRDSLLTSFTEEKLNLEAERRKEAHALRARVSELEGLINEKEEKIRGLMQEITNIEESRRASLLEMKTCHKQNLSEMYTFFPGNVIQNHELCYFLLLSWKPKMKKQRAELKEIRLEGLTMVETLQTKHKSELQASQSVAEEAHLQAKEIKQQLEEKLEKLQVLSLQPTLNKHYNLPKVE
ncbi:hypothetical protein R1flu_012890 [Riccia fluitans]|uniref:Uncharacterized protein n=1 Tax=Riccia fluitans TaxID=41844 RepID=A0ABD1ZD49_9MARC